MSHTPAAPAYLSLRNAAEHLGLTERCVRRYIADGLLPAYRLGPRQIRIKRSDIDALLEPIPTAGPIDFTGASA